MITQRHLKNALKTVIGFNEFTSLLNSTERDVCRVKKLNTYQIEITDTFGGEANYSWVRRYTYKAKSELGAMQMLAKEYGAGWVKAWSSNDLTRYNLRGCCVCAFVEYVE